MTRDLESPRAHSPSWNGPVCLGCLKTRKAPEGALSMDFLDEENGAGEGIRTLDPNLGKVVLYP
jgi:hypothetical protein